MNYCLLFNELLINELLFDINWTIWLAIPPIEYLRDFMKFVDI